MRSVPDMICGMVILMVSGSTPARSSSKWNTIGSIFVSMFVDADGVILVITGLDGALNEKE